MSKTAEIVLFFVLFIGLDLTVKWTAGRSMKHFDIQIRHKFIWYISVFVIAVICVIAANAVFPQIADSMISIGITLGIVTGIAHAIRDEVATDKPDGAEH